MIIPYGQGIGPPACFVAGAGLPPARPPCAEPLATLRPCAAPPSRQVCRNSNTIPLLTPVSRAAGHPAS